MTALVFIVTNDKSVKGVFSLVNNLKSAKSKAATLLGRKNLMMDTQLSSSADAKNPLAY
jgi:hypothetical protein